MSKVMNQQHVLTLNTALGSGQPTPRIIQQKLRGSEMGDECDHRCMLWKKMSLSRKTPKIGTVTSEERQIVRENTTLEKVTHVIDMETTLWYSAEQNTMLLQDYKDKRNANKIKRQQHLVDIL